MLIQRFRHLNLHTVLCLLLSITEFVSLIFCFKDINGFIKPTAFNYKEWITS